MSATFEEAIQPLLEMASALEADIGKREAELAKLKDQRNRLRQAVRAVAPELLPATAKKQRSPGTKFKFSERNRDYVSEFLRTNWNGSEFTTNQVLGHPEYTGPTQTTLSRILVFLHEAGSIRMVRRGRGGERFYEVIR